MQYKDTWTTTSYGLIITGVEDVPLCILFLSMSCAAFRARFRFCTRSINGGQCGWPISRVNLENPGLGENGAEHIEQEEGISGNTTASRVHCYDHI